MKVKEVAEMLGTTVETVRVGLQQGMFPFGVAIKKNPENSRYVYIIFPEKVREYVGVKNEEISH